MQPCVLYCFARPTHEYLGLGVGEDFERKLVVKVNAVERLRAELSCSALGRGPHRHGDQHRSLPACRGRYHLTRGIVEALGEARNPFSILTKSTLILRDLDLLVAAAARTDVHCNLSIGTLDEAVWKATEPGTPHPRRRVEAVRRLNDAGIPTGVLMAPIIPGWSDRPDQLEEVATACVEAGAVFVTPIVLHLRRGVKEHFLDFMKEHHPDRHGALARRYARSAYLSPTEQEAITARVHAVVSPERRRRSRADTFGHPESSDPPPTSGRRRAGPGDTGSATASTATGLSRFSAGSMTHLRT